MTNLSSPVLYQERTLPSLGFYAATLFVPVAVFVIALPFSEEVGIVLAVLSLALVLLATWIFSPLISLTADRLTIGKVKIETKYLGKAMSIEGDEVFMERGTLLDSRAYTVFQIGVKQLVKIDINDERDPTPYWLIASRNPEVIAGLLNKL